MKKKKLPKWAFHHKLKDLINKPYLRSLESFRHEIGIGLISNVNHAIDFPKYASAESVINISRDLLAFVLTINTMENFVKKFKKKQAKDKDKDKYRDIYIYLPYFLYYDAYSCDDVAETNASFDSINDLINNNEMGKLQELANASKNGYLFMGCYPLFIVCLLQQIDLASREKIVREEIIIPLDREIVECIDEYGMGYLIPEMYKEQVDSFRTMKILLQSVGAE